METEEDRVREIVLKAVRMSKKIRTKESIKFDKIEVIGYFNEKRDGNLVRLD